MTDRDAANRPGNEPVQSADVSTASLLSWGLYDWANSSFSSVILTFVFAAYFTRQVAENQTIGTTEWGTVIGIVGIVVAMGGPVLGSLVDQHGPRKPWIILFTLLCVTATALLWFVKPSTAYVEMGLLLVALANLASEFGNIFYNAMLPQLVSANRLGRWSGWGWALGYAGGLSCLVLSLLAFVRSHNPWIELDRHSAQDVRATFVFVAAWYLSFSLPLFLVTPDTSGTGKSLSGAARDGIRQLRDSLKHVMQYRHIMRFLVARMIYIDGLGTLFVFGGVYAAGTFHMTEPQVLLFGIALNIAAGLGAFGFAWLDDRFGSRRTILVSLLGLILGGTLILLAHSLFVFWVFGLLIGLFVGPVQASSRALLARAAPRAMRNEMFGLYALSGKATAFVGPLLVGWTTYFTNSQRLGMATIIGLFLVGFVLMLRVPRLSLS